MKRIAYLSLLLLAFTLAGCKKTIPVRNYMDQSIASYSQNSTVDTIEKSILRAAISLGWKTKITKKGEILATLDIRKHQLVVLITHDDKSYSIEYKDSTNLLYDGKQIHRQYANWINNLIRTINAYSINI